MLDRLRQAFLDPPTEFTPVPFWFWNDSLQSEEIVRQIQSFREKGVLGFVIHPRIGIPREIEYLSDRYMDFVEAAVREAARLGMIVFLYDEAMYPSGSAHGLVVKGNPEYASRALKMVEWPCRGGTAIQPKLGEDDALVSVQAVHKIAERTIDPRHSTRLGLVGGRIPFCAPHGEDWSILLFIETYSGGVIRGIHFGEDDWEADAPPAADLLNPDAVRKFMRITYDRFYERLWPCFGTTIQAIFTDEPNMLGKRASREVFRPWTGRFLQWYEQHGGNELDLPALWLDVGPDTEMIRRRYEKAVHRRLETTYYRPISEWCAEHRIALTGHPHASDDIGSLQHFHIPGQDLVLRWVAPENGKALEGEHSTLAKCASDAARHAGRRRNLVECFGCCGRLGMGWSLTADDMKWYMDWLFVRGVNWLVPHAFYYSIRGPRRIGERPPDVGPNNIWWPYYPSISTYIKRLSWLMTDSVNVTEVAVLCERDHLPWAIVKPLYQNQIEFNYLTVEQFASADCRLDRGTATIERQRYRVILVEDPTWIAGPVRAKLAQFVADGGVAIVHSPTKHTPDTDSFHRMSALEEVSALVAQLIRRDPVLMPAHADLRVSHLVKDGIHMYLLVNEGEDTIEGRLCLGVVGRLEVWDPWEGRIDAGPPLIATDNHLETPIHLERRASLVLCVDPTQDPQAVPGPQDAGSAWTIALNRGWQIRGAPAQVPQEKAFESWTEWPGMEHFSGTLGYECTFELGASGPAHIALDLGQACEIAHVFVNDQDAGVRMWAPYRFDLTPFVRPGKNDLRIEVTNTLANRIDDTQMASGLLGPVRLICVAL